jgi:hypothetical protein
MQGFRWFAAGWFLVCAGCAAALATMATARPSPMVVVQAPIAPPPVVVHAPGPALRVIDAVHGLTGEALAGVLRLERCERIAAIDDRGVRPGVAPAAALAAAGLAAPRALDLAIEGGPAERRVIVVLH